MPSVVVDKPLFKSIDSFESVVSKTTLLNQGIPAAKREEILHYFHQSFSLYESLFECLASDEAFNTRGTLSLEEAISTFR